MHYLRGLDATTTIWNSERTPPYCPLPKHVASRVNVPGLVVCRVQVSVPSAPRTVGGRGICVGSQLVVTTESPYPVCMFQLSVILLFPPRATMNWSPTLVRTLEPSSRSVYVVNFSIVALGLLDALLDFVELGEADDVVGAMEVVAADELPALGLALSLHPASDITAATMNSSDIGRPAGVC